jgi:hypothetical protein
VESRDERLPEAAWVVEPEHAERLRSSIDSGWFAHGSQPALFHAYS